MSVFYAGLAVVAVEMSVFYGGLAVVAVGMPVFYGGLAFVAVGMPVFYGGLAVFSKARRSSLQLEQVTGRICSETLREPERS